MSAVKLPNGWEPREYQRPLWEYLSGGGKRAVQVAHRRWGKDDVALHHTACSAFERVGNYWHLLPEATQARKAIWDAVNPHSGKRRIDEAFPDALRSGVRNNEMSINFKNGATWQVVGSDNYNSLVGSPPVGLVFSEWSLANPASWAYLRPILAENGGWALFIYTPRGRNHGVTLYDAARDNPGWYADKSPATHTSVFTKDQLDQELKEYMREFGREDGESRFRQEYLCDFNVAVIGAYYGKSMADAEDQDRICKVSHDKSLTVDTWWDLGHSDATAIWFVQHAFNAIHVIDYYEINGADLDFLAKVLQEKRDAKGYIYGRHVWPHDGGHKTLASGGRRLSDMFGDLGFPVEVQRPHDVQVGITRVRQVLPRCWFDREATALGVEALRSYAKDWDEVRRVYSAKPTHNWASHGSDAFRTGAMAYTQAGAGKVKKRDRYAGDWSGRLSGWSA
mgnify:CR=1 FL=1